MLLLNSFYLTHTIWYLNCSHSLDVYPSVELHISYSGERLKHKSPLYPYQMIRCRVIFIYGSDYSRQPAHHGFDVGNYGLFNVLIVIISILLLILRWQANLQKDISINFLEACAIFYGGGNIRAEHKLERIFYAIALIGMFFLISLILGDFSMKSIVSQRFEKIDSFSKLAERNMDFFITYTLTEHKEQITGMLK